LKIGVGKSVLENQDARGVDRLVTSAAQSVSPRFRPKRAKIAANSFVIKHQALTHCGTNIWREMFGKVFAVKHGG
jgi:hypothetical protein